MKNDLFSIGPFTVHGYGLMMAIAILSAYFMVEYRAKKRGYEEDRIFYLTVFSVAGGLLGAKLLYLGTRLGDIIEDPSLIISSLANGFVVYGSIIGGIAAAWIYCRVKKLKFLELFDLVAPALAMAQGIGRIGCFLAGCCYGMQVAEDHPLAIVFQESQFAPNHVPLLNTQLISSALNFVHFAVLMLLSKKFKTPGRVGACYLIFYSIGRFILEFFRGDLIRGSVGTFSTSQFISIFMFVGGLLLFVLLPRFARPEKSEETAPCQE